MMPSFPRTNPSALAETSAGGRARTLIGGMLPAERPRSSNAHISTVMDPIWPALQSGLAIRLYLAQPSPQPIPAGCDQGRQRVAARWRPAPLTVAREAVMFF